MVSLTSRRSQPLPLACGLQGAPTFAPRLPYPLCPMSTSTVAEPKSSPSDSGAPAVSKRVRQLRLPSWWVLGPVLLYLALVLAGVTQSSIGIENLREDPSVLNSRMVSSALAIRSDEYLTSTPLSIGVTARGATETLNPLTAPDGFSTMMPDGPVSSVVLFDGTILRAGPSLPDQMLIAARWWMPFLLLALGAPAFFRNLTGSRSIGLFAAALMMFSPSSAWWSFSPMGMLGFTFAGAAALQTSARALGDGRRWPALGWALLSAVLLARTPLHYQPWAIVIAPTILLVAIVGLVADRWRRRTNLLAIAATGVASLALFGGVVVENLAGIKATLGTVYPGSRVATGGPTPLQEIFGAPLLGRLRETAVTGTNPSELSSSFAVVAVWAVLILAFGALYRDRRHRWATLTATAVVGFWFTWILVDFGTPGSQVPGLNMVPPQRAADVIGYVAILLVCLLLPALPDRPRRGFAVLAGAVVGLVTAHAGSLLRSQNMADLSVMSIWIASFVVAALVVAITLRPRFWGTYAVAVALAFALVAKVNPVLFGLGDLRGSGIAQELLEEGADARANGDVWVSDSPYVDTLLAATGVPSLSGRQLAGPDLDGWGALDPERAHEEVWNRGGSYIWFAWDDDPDLKFTNAGPDVISVAGSPCAIAELMPEVSTIIASHPLDQPCLMEVDTFTWATGEHWVYDIAP